MSERMLINMVSSTACQDDNQDELSEKNSFLISSPGLYNTDFVSFPV